MTVFRTVSLEEVRRNPLVLEFIEAANNYLGVIGYTEHGTRHVSLVSSIARNVLSHLGYDARTCELAAIAGFLHDIGNVINRTDHGQSSGVLAAGLLREMGMPPEEIAVVIGAIGNHEEEIGDPVSPVCAALILGDKSDVHRSRVRNPRMIAFDIHDRVNYAVQKSFLEVNRNQRLISLKLEVDTAVSRIIEYFEIFMPRLVICRRSAAHLACAFELVVNGQKLV
jgi:metal-dependent HD superfamily phosphatase/phosphodiesterase